MKNLRHKTIAIFIAVIALVLTAGIALAGEVFFDNFNRSNSATLGNGWDEYEESGNAVSIYSNKMKFNSGGSGIVNALHTFDGTDTGDVELEFNINVNRTGSDDPYYFHMQLGDSDEMEEDDLTGGIAANLVWRVFNGSQESYVALDGSSKELCFIADGEVEVQITADMATETWTVLLHELYTGEHTECFLEDLDFRDDEVSQIDAVRFWIGSMKTSDFTGRTIDPVWIGVNE